MGFTLQGASSQPQYYAGAMSLDSVGTDPLSGTVNDLNVPGATLVNSIVLNCSGAVTLNGLQGGSANRVLTLINASNQTVTLAANASGSSAANRFASAGSIASGAALTLIYSALLSLWILGGAAAATPSYQTIAFVNASALASGAGNSVTVSVPSGVAKGDALIAVCESDGSNAAAFTNAGFTQVFTFPQPADSGQTTVLYRVATASEPANYTFTSVAAGGCGGAMLAYRNVNQSALFNTSIASYGSVIWTSNSFPVSAGGGVTTLDNCVLVWIGTGDSNTNGTYTVIGVPSGYTNRVSGQDTSKWNAIAVGEKTLGTAGAFAAASATWTQTGGSFGGACGIQLALQPALVS